VRETLFDVPFGSAVALFLLLAAVDHLLVAAPRVVDWYEANLGRGINYARWIEYSVSASIMVVLIAMLAGITGVYALIGLFAANAAMILFGLLMERENPPGRPVRWLPFWLGCVIGAAPWVAIAVAVGGAEAESGGVPTFVFAIFVSLFVLFNSFAINMALQYRRVGRWREYRFGESAYLVLSLVAKSALAWQVFAGALAA
jgi:bacteriorhodopsin